MTENTQASLATRTSGLAIASLVLGIIGFFAIPLVASVLAVILGKQAQRELASDPSMGGHGYARAGVILGWIGIALSVVGGLVASLFIFAFF